MYTPRDSSDSESDSSSDEDRTVRRSVRRHTSYADTEEEKKDDEEADAADTHEEAPTDAHADSGLTVDEYFSKYYPLEHSYGTAHDGEFPEMESPAADPTPTDKPSHYHSHGTSTTTDDAATDDAATDAAATDDAATDAAATDDAATDDAATDDATKDPYSYGYYHAPSSYDTYFDTYYPEGKFDKHIVDTDTATDHPATEDGDEEDDEDDMMASDIMSSAEPHKP